MTNEQAKAIRILREALKDCARHPRLAQRQNIADKALATIESATDAPIAAGVVPEGPAAADIAYMVNRFLGWPLPKTFGPDCGVSFDGRKDDEWNKNKPWPIGTNLLTAIEAKAMFEYCLNGKPAAPAHPVAGSPAEAEPLWQWKYVVDREWWEFMAALSLQSGGMLNGNRVSERARELLVSYQSKGITTPAQASPPTDDDILRIAAPYVSDDQGFFRKPELFEIVAFGRAILDVAPASPAVATVACWSCKRPYTMQQRADADGNCPHCGVEIELDATDAPIIPEAGAEELPDHLCETVSNGNLCIYCGGLVETGLPSLPIPSHRGPDGTGAYFDSFTADQMCEYARAALQQQAGGDTPGGDHA